MGLDGHPHGPDALVRTADVIGSERTTIQSIDRAADILALLDQDTRSLTSAVVAERLGLNRTTAHRYLQSLQVAGFLSATFGPGPLLDQLAALVSVRQQILTHAPAVMRDLADETSLTTVLSFLGRSGAVVTLVEEANQDTIVLTVRIGTVLEAKAAQTRVFLAFHSDPALMKRAHAKLSPAEVVLEQDGLVTVRRHRLAWADLDGEGVASVAVPVFTRSEMPCALALLGTTTMLPPRDRFAEPVHALERAAQTLGSMIAN
jgi:DNA-binding IclR family transcriptional regulator